MSNIFSEWELVFPPFDRDNATLLQSEYPSPILCVFRTRIHTRPSIINHLHPSGISFYTRFCCSSNVRAPLFWTGKEELLFLLQLLEGDIVLSPSVFLVYRCGTIPAGDSRSILRLIAIHLAEHGYDDFALYCYGRAGAFAEWCALYQTRTYEKSNDEIYWRICDEETELRALCGESDFLLHVRFEGETERLCAAVGTALRKEAHCHYYSILLEELPDKENLNCWSSLPKILIHFKNRRKPMFVVASSLGPAVYPYTRMD